MDSGGEIMCKFFSFVTDPVNHPAEYYYFDWEYRKDNFDDDGAEQRIRRPLTKR